MNMVPDPNGILIVMLRTLVECATGRGKGAATECAES
jgi:hypothetical protein